MKIAVDFDGTCVDHRYTGIGRDVPGAVSVLRRLAGEGHSLFLYTMRSGKFLADAIRWFKNRNIPLSGINQDPEQVDWTCSPKCYADVYIDDAAFGCPMISQPGFRRPCVDWDAVGSKLLSTGGYNGSTENGQTAPKHNTCIFCRAELLEERDGVRGGGLACLCAKCRAEERHNYDVEPDVSFNHDGSKVGEG